MEFIVQNILELIGLLLILITSVWGLIKYFQAQLESQRREFETKIAEVHSRVNDVREKYVHQDHLDDILNGIEKSVGNVADEQRRTNDRLDSLFKHLISEAKK